jgi:hypothetical protein
MSSSYVLPLIHRRVGVGICIFLFLGLMTVLGRKLAEGPMPSDPAKAAHRLEGLVDERPSKVWEDLAFAYVKAKMYDKAPEAFRKVAEFYRQEGDVNAAIQFEMKAEKFEADAQIYKEVPSELSDHRFYTGAKFEPVHGCYLGVFIDNEDKLTQRFPETIEWISGSNRKPTYTKQRPAAAPFDKEVGVKHAIFFLYVGYGVRFPARWAADLKAHNAAAQIAFEPETLDDVQDDEYLRQFARDAKASGIPIFLRFASEMNGNWTPYHGDPAKYIEKWKLVTRVMREEAPNVAMLWCVFETPITKVEQYYPGKEWVDWVGVNVYSVPYFNNDPKQPAFWRNPADGLKFVYDKFSANHPIMIAEYASSHLSSLDNVYRGHDAEVKLSQFYTALPRLYPRVKAVCWLSMNAIVHAIPGRQKNNYSLLYDEGKTRRYREVTNSPWFLHDLTSTEIPSSPIRYERVSPGATIPFPAKLSAWARAWENEPTIEWMLDGKQAVREQRVGAYEWQPKKPGRIELRVTDSRGVLAADTQAILEANGPSKPVRNPQP